MKYVLQTTADGHSPCRLMSRNSLDARKEALAIAIERYRNNLVEDDDFKDAVDAFLEACGYCIEEQD